ncbi:hypothetical protein CPB84DRAFT_1786485 [Gymnopilus junonius]|uniref:Uncharacterized protein n=1 Tax=Gymnopilus junonius TaxID=109634 RepID=A0A9P5NJY1_GYMJU|nr:hypothetical protein CPB84DRAFT_1786485 [Gymnopilus junonius]
MAQPTQDIKVLSDTTGQEVKEQAVERSGGGLEVSGLGQADENSSSTPSVAPADSPAEKSASQSSITAQPSAPSARPSLVPLGSSHAQTSSLTPVAPHPKRFSAVNINKKFLEKNTASGSSGSSVSSVAKSGSPAARPSIQPTSSHSRLVTTKLTASPAVTSSTAGWSRPSSVAPSPATASNSPSSTSPLPTAPPTQSPAPGAPQLPHAGKVIHPQPRNTVAPTSSSHKESGGTKPVWGNVKPPTAAPLRPDIEPIASSIRKQSKALEETKVTSDAAAKQLRLEEADAFRGVHLNPNVHHWDDMEEDDDNFLGGVIEFGDGRQYKIESTEQSGAPPARGLSQAHAADASQKEPTAGPVSKEERFVDDFDRSWPKSRNSPASASKDVAPSPSISPVMSHSTQSPKDSSRVLFNERSNRLEPYSQSHRPGSFASKRSNHQEGPGAHEPRSAREGSIQVLQKSSGHDFGSRGRRYSASSTGFSAGAPNGYPGDRHRDREPPVRREGPPPSPRFSREHPPLGTETGGRDFDGDRSRRNFMGPPSHAGQKHPQDGGRQLPPHLVQLSPNAPLKRLPSRERRFSPSEPSAALPLPTSTGITPHSPAVSQNSLNVVSPASATNIPLPLSAPDLDVARKDVMHTAAERAKQRRQQEEQEREAQKERARRKAAELEEKMKAAEAEKERRKREEEAKAVAKESEAVKLIEDAVKSVELSVKPTTDAMARDPATGKSLPEPLTGTSVTSPDSQHLESSRQAGIIPPRTAPLPTSAGSQSESWRTRTAGLPSAVPRQIQTRPPASATFIPSGPSAIEQVESIAGGSKDDLEVVDFTDMSKFVAVQNTAENASENAVQASAAPSILTKPPRPVASDFFEDQTTPTTPATASKGAGAGFGAWRKKVSQDARPDIRANAIEDHSKSEQSDHPSVVGKEQLRGRDSSFSPDSSMMSTKEPLSYQEVNGGQIVQLPQTVRSPRTQAFYKEAPMSALDDAMSRIKGVLVGMHAETPREIATSGSVDQDVQSLRTNQIATQQAHVRLVPKERWVPPALRQRNFDDADEPREVFLVTVLQPPTTPPPTNHVVRLPTVSRRVDNISKKQLHAFFRPPYQARLDILSFDPPVHDMNRRDLSLNDVLFRRPPPGFKGKFKYRVMLPRRRGPKVNMPSVLAKPNVTGAFGRPTVADGATSWRKSAASSTIQVKSSYNVHEPDTTSCSPPPQSSPPESNAASIPKSSESTSKSDTNTTTRSRSQPKMPEGSGVAFMRDSRIDVVEADTKPLVNFIVGSQLEEAATTDSPKAVSSVEDSASKPPDTKSGHSVTLNGLATSSATSVEDGAPSLTSSKAESSDALNDHILITPPGHHSSTPWARSSVSLPIKDTSARAPDHEHLKALWSQTSNKANLHSVNSLEGIADDLTSLPFTIHDVKSEDGETPPPSLPSAPSRMSLHEVTRAFQTVPTSSSSSSQSSHRATFSPPSTNAPVARPTTATTTYAYSPAPQSSMRPAYVSYPSPMMSHSPSPVIYGHPMASSPVPGRMQINGHTSLFSQPVWMPMPGPSAQAPSNMIRPVASPYPPAQMLPYPTGYAPQAPPTSMMHAPQGQATGRGRGMPVMSPVMSHAHAHPASAMYASSPVMLHAVPVPQNHGYMPVSTGRGVPPRTENGQVPTSQQHPAHNNHQPHTAFHPASASPFVRSAW